MEFNFQYLLPLVANLLRYFLLAGIPFLLFYLLFSNRFTRNKIQSRFARNKDFIREILHSIQTNFIISGVILVLFFTPLRDYTQIYTEASAYPLWWIPLSIFIAMVIHDTYFYWMHRTLHHPKLYKTVHLEHHKSTNPSPWAALSFNFLEGLAETMIVPLIIFLLPMHPIALLSFGLISLAINVYGHLGFEIMPKWVRHTWIFEILNTSVHHNLHHAKFKGNYGLYFRVWDRLMGTEHPDYVREYDRIQAQRFGGESPKTTLAPL